jgi:hypothetical protein
MRRSLHAAALAFLALVGSASAQSLRALRAQDADDSRLAEEISYTNSVCGGSISGRIDWLSAIGWPESESLAEACDGALGALETVCRGGGAARAAKVSAFVCAGDGSGPSLRGGTFRYGAAPGGDSFGDSLSYLEGAL